MLPPVYLGSMNGSRKLMFDRQPVSKAATKSSQLGKFIGVPSVFGLQSDFTLHVEICLFVNYLVEFQDSFDAFLICLLKVHRQFPVLRFYHAADGGIWGWFMLTDYDISFNGVRTKPLVYTVAHFHLFWIALGLKYTLKTYDTKLQIAQFYTCMFVVLYDRAPAGHFSIECCCAQHGDNVAMIHPLRAVLWLPCRPASPGSKKLEATHRGSVNLTYKQTFADRVVAEAFLLSPYIPNGMAEPAEQYAEIPARQKLQTLRDFVQTDDVGRGGRQPFRISPTRASSRASPLYGYGCGHPYYRSNATPHV